MSSQPEDIFTWRTKELRRWWFSGGSDEPESFDDSNRNIRETAATDEANPNKSCGQRNPLKVYRELNGMQR